MKYPVYQPQLAGKEKEYVIDCLDSTWISSKGKYVNQFENVFSDYIDVKYATAVSNGTVALHLAMVALGIGRDDEVIVPTFTYIASVNSVVYVGAKPVFADSIEKTWQLDPEDVIRKITPKTKAIMAVHLYGQSCEIEKLREICDAHKIFLIEDCAEALGTKFKERHVGTLGDISTFSFYGNKTITTGEGGMVVTNDKTLYQRAVSFKGQGLAKYREYWHDVVGYNFRMTNICAAIGCAQMERVDEVIKKKRLIAQWYRNRFESTEYHFHEEQENTVHSYWMCSILIPEKIERVALREHMNQAGIETRPLFYPVHTMPMYADKYEKHPIAEKLGLSGINLPSYPDLEEEDVDFIVKTILNFSK